MLIGVLVLLAHSLGGLERLDLALQDLRTAKVHRPASGDIVFVAIDAKSLASVGTWPWSRRVHADLLDRFTEAGAAEVFFDIDFSFAGDAAGDRAFAEAIERAGNVSLPRFIQAERHGSARITQTRPQAAFGRVAWPVAANVSTDRSGLVRDYPFGRFAEDGFIPSAGAYLSGQYRETDGHFAINFAVDPATVPSVSATDVLAGRLPPEAVAGRIVVVGASAVELGDFFNVPVHGIVPGALVHILAAETLRQSLIIGELRIEVVVAALVGLLLLLQSPRLDRPARPLAALVLSLVASEALVFGLLVQANVTVPTALPYAALIGFTLWSLANQLDLRDLVIRMQRKEVKGAKDLLDQVFLDSFDARFLFDARENVLIQSQTATKMFGTAIRTASELPPNLHRAVRKAVGPDAPAAPSGMSKAVVTWDGKEHHIEYYVTPSSVVEPGEADVVTKRVATLSVRDVTLLREREREIAYLSSYDHLTGALRRNTFADFLTLRKMAGERFAVIALNLHRFKTINVVLGRDIGDAVLKATVARIERAGLGVSAVARLEGDAFAVFTEAAVDEAEAETLADRLGALVGDPFVIDGLLAKVDARVGYTLIEPADDADADTILSRVEAALDIARSTNAPRPLLYDAGRIERRDRARAIERGMETALQQGEFYVTYQPQHRVTDGKLIGSEALVRWTSARLGPVPPDDFIEIAESNGFIGELGPWVLRQALTDTQRLPGDLSVAVNVSAAQLLGTDVVNDVTHCLAETGFPADRLCLELTESVFALSSGEIVERMRDLQFMGATWALDDFGTGYASLGYLSSFPIEKLKLDRSFMTDLGSDPAALAIFLSVKSLCRGLGIKLLCEGVETAGQLEILRANGCDEAQGYLYGKPMAYEEFAAYVDRHGERPGKVS